MTLSKVTVATLLTCLPLCPVYAGFSVDHHDAPNGFSISGHPLEAPAFGGAGPEDGYAHTAAYHAAVTSSHSLTDPRHIESLPSVAMNYQEPEEPEVIPYTGAAESLRMMHPVNHRWYLQAKLGLAANKLNDITKDNSLAGTVSETEHKDEGVGYELGIGYKWNAWRTEFSMMKLDSLTYNPQPVLTGAAALRNMSSKILTRAFFANFLHDFSAMYGFHMYAGGGVGLALNEVDASTSTTAGTVTATHNKEKTQLAFNGTVGARYRMTSRLWLDANIRLAYLGKALWGPVDGIKLKTDEYFSSGINMGVSYQF